VPVGAGAFHRRTGADEHEQHLGDEGQRGPAGERTQVDIDPSGPATAVAIVLVTDTVVLALPIAESVVASAATTSKSGIAGAPGVRAPPRHHPWLALHPTFCLSLVGGTITRGR
jgi:hypothetical protein